MRLNYYQDSWPLQVECCPCDVHFTQYLEREKVKGRAIFHFGTGEHHLVGKRCSDRRLANEVLGITASRKEYESYIDLIIGSSRIARWYKVLFADIYTLTPGLLSSFDFVTLFHLGEYYDARTSRYAPLDDRSLLDLFLTKLKPEGRILFYRGSAGFPTAGRIIDDFVRKGRISRIGEYETLLVYAQP